MNRKAKCIWPGLPIFAWCCYRVSINRALTSAGLGVDCYIVLLCPQAPSEGTHRPVLLNQQREHSWHLNQDQSRQRNPQENRTSAAVITKPHQGITRPSNLASPPNKAHEKRLSPICTSTPAFDRTGAKYRADFVPVGCWMSAFSNSPPISVSPITARYPTIPFNTKDDPRCGSSAR